MTASTRTEQAYWREPLAPYARPHVGRSVANLATSVLPYLALSYAMYRSLALTYWVTLAIGVLAAGFLVRTFIVFHDCTHGSFLPSRRANAWLGRALGILLLVPFLRWQHDHAVHHATSGDLDRRGTGDVPTLTVREYQQLSLRARLAYRAFRNPLVMFGIGPIVAMVVGPRIVAKGTRPRMRRSVLATNLGLAVVVAGLCLLTGWSQFLLVWAPPALLAGSAGIWLFYVQHQFEDAYWQDSSSWSYSEAALQGSSYLKLPRVLQFFSGNIGLHHVHHLDAKIPNYNLQRAHEETALFAEVPTLTLLDGLRAVRLKLFDEQSGRLVTWAQARAAMLSPHGGEPASQQA